MSEFWIGVTVGLAVWFFFETIATALLAPTTVDLEYSDAATKGAIGVVLLVLANLIFLGVI